MVGRSNIDVHTYKSMQIPNYVDGRDLFPSFKGVPDNF